MNIEINCGFATRYFITDATRSLAIVEAPCTLVVAHHLGLDQLAEALSWLIEEKPREPKGCLWWLIGGGAEQPELEGREGRRRRLRADFDEIIQARPAFSFGFNEPIVFLAENAHDDALAVTAVLKLRGCAAILGIVLADAGVTLADYFRPLNDLFNDGQGAETADRPCRVWRFKRGLSVVAGLSGAVFSTEMTAEQIIASYPTLAGPPSSEPIDDLPLPGTG